MSQPPSESKQQEPVYDFSSIPINELDITKTKLLNLTKSLYKLQDELSKPNMVRWESLHGQYIVIIRQLNSLASEIFKNQEIFSARNVYPLPTFPTTEQEGLLTTLLRKKPNPEVSDWIDQAQDFVNELDIDVHRIAPGEQIDDEENFMNWCGEVLEDEQQEFNFFGVYTKEEIDAGKNTDSHMFKIEKKQTNDEDKPKIGLTADQTLRFIYTGEV